MLPGWGIEFIELSKFIKLSKLSNLIKFTKLIKEESFFGVFCYILV